MAPAVFANVKLLVQHGIVRMFGIERLDRLRALKFFWSVRRTRVPFEREILALPYFVSAGDVCIDIGASYGHYTYHLSRLVGESGRVVSFEPLPSAYRILAAMCQRFGLDNVETYALALSDRRAREVMYVPQARKLIPDYGRAYLGGTSGIGVPACASEELLVRTVTLDDFLRPELSSRVRFVKCDVEGAELRVLRGAERTLMSSRPVLLCEVEDRHLRKYGIASGDVLSWLSARGYAPFVQTTGGWKVVAGTQDDSQRNFFFIPNERISALPMT